MKDFRFPFRQAQGPEAVEGQISDLKLSGGSSSPLLDAKIRRRSRISSGIARGAADPPIRTLQSAISRFDKLKALSQSKGNRQSAIV
jgi:hypothetical protein